MIVLTDPTGLRVVTQPDHASLGAEMLSLWRVEALLLHPRRQALLRAIRLHDNGWQEADSAPRVNPASGRPWTFLDLPAESRREIWRRGIERYATSSPYVALLVARHALELFRPRRHEEAWGDFVEALEVRCLELGEIAGLVAEDLELDYGWLRLADTLSLVACAGWPGPETLDGWTARRRGQEIELDPLPLAGATRFRLACRFIPDRRYHSDADLAGELATSRWQTVTVRLVGPSSSP